MDIYKILETLKRVEESNVEGIRINGKEVDMSSLAIADVRTNDYPDFSDAFISDGYYTDGTPISDDDLEMLTQERGDLVNALAHEVATEQGAMRADMEMEEGWDPRQWGIWDKMNWDAGATSFEEKFREAYPEKVARIAQGGGIGVQRTNNDVATAKRMLVKHLTMTQKQPWSPEMTAQVDAQLKADVAKAQAGQQVATAEGKDFPFANPKQKPGDQVRGTEVAKKSKDHPFKNRLVGANEGAVRLEKSFADYLNEYGMTTGGTTTGASVQQDPVAKAKQVSNVQQNINKLKSAGVNIPNVSQAVSSVLKDPTDPASQLDKNVAQGLGQEIDQIVTKGDPSAVNQLATLIKKVKQGI